MVGAPRLALLAALVLTGVHHLPNISYPKYHIAPALALLVFASPVVARRFAQAGSKRGRAFLAVVLSACFVPNLLLPWNLVKSEDQTPPQKIRGAATAAKTLVDAHR